MAKLYYGNGQCTIEGNAYGIEINYKGTINIEDKTSEGFALISNERRIIIFPTGIVGEVVLNELFDYTGQLKILSIIVSNEQGEREYCTIHKVMDYAELLNTKAEDLTTNSEDLSSGYSSEKGLNKTAIAKQKIIPNIHTSDHNGLLYLKNRSGVVTDFKNIDDKSLRNLLASSEWTRVNELKDMTPYAKPKKKAKKKAKKK